MKRKILLAAIALFIVVAVSVSAVFIATTASQQSLAEFQAKGLLKPPSAAGAQNSYQRLQRIPTLTPTPLPTPTPIPPTKITTCGIIANMNTNYELANDLNGMTQIALKNYVVSNRSLNYPEYKNGFLIFNACLAVIANNATLDCKGHTISGANSNFTRTYAIVSIKNSNFTLKNCNIVDYNQGVSLLETNNSALIKNTIFNNQNYVRAVYAEESRNVKLESNHFGAGNTINMLELIQSQVNSKNDEFIGTEIFNTQNYPSGVVAPTFSIDRSTFVNPFSQPTIAATVSMQDYNNQNINARYMTYYNGPYYFPPAGYVAVLNKGITTYKISPNDNSNITIESISLHWKDAEINEFDENIFGLWTYNFLDRLADHNSIGNWIPLPATLNPATNTLTLKNVNSTVESNESGTILLLQPIKGWKNLTCPKGFDLVVLDPLSCDANGKISGNDSIYCSSQNITTTNGIMKINDTLVEPTTKYGIKLYSIEKPYTDYEVGFDTLDDNKNSLGKYVIFEGTKNTFYRNPQNYILEYQLNQIIVGGGNTLRADVSLYLHAKTIPTGLNQLSCK